MRGQEAELFEQQVKPPEVARRLGVSPKPTYRWHQWWREGRTEARPVR
ncbi:helix-turn-helix domain-containing protein [Kitasatospora sp. NPDC058046]